MRFAIAKAVSAASTWGLRNVFHRPAGNFPGKMALYVDPQLIAHLRSRLSEGSVIVVGTNGKTSTCNLLADAFEAWGKEVMCNRSGANLDSGVATTMLQARRADWGVFETDELWMVRILPQLKANYVLLLNLFRDQLDRVGEIDRIQDSIVRALSQSPDTVLVYNADDPHCQAIADAVPNRTVAFGLSEVMGEGGEGSAAAAASAAAASAGGDAQMCQKCSHVLNYSYRQYGQLGDYVCPNCGFARSALDIVGSQVSLAADGVTFACTRAEDGSPEQLRSSQSSPYMVYNLLAAYAVASLAGCPTEVLQKAIDAFNPRNGRLQRYRIGQRDVLLNLAKNPTGFNQNLGIVCRDGGPKAVAFFVNDKEGDGRDVSWLWDVAFEELAAQRECAVFAGGIRKNDLQVRLKYAGVNAYLVDTVEDMFSCMGEGRAMADGHALPADASVYVIANYTALPPVHDELDAMEAAAASSVVEAASAKASEAIVPASVESVAVDATPASAESASAGASPVVIAHLFPELLNLNGDGGNVTVLQQRLAWRGVPVEVRRIAWGETLEFADVDLVFLGSGPEREQKMAAEGLLPQRDALKSFATNGGVVLAAGGGFPLLGSSWLSGDEVLEGLGLIDMRTERPASHSASAGGRLVNNVVLNSPLAQAPVVGYENHAGRTFLGSGVQPFGTVASSTGCGNNEADKVDGALCGTLLGTYLHGPVLAKNPEVADWLLARAVEHCAVRVGEEPFALESLDDAEESAANAYAVGRFR